MQRHLAPSLLKPPLEKPANWEYSFSLGIFEGKADLQLKINPEALLIYNKVDNFLTAQGIKSYLVGGFVRDTLLDIDSADTDIAISGDTLEITPRLAEVLGGKYVLLDRVNRVTRVVLQSKDAPTKSGQWHLDFTTFKGKIEPDLARRDFTIDALAINLSELVKDPTHIQIIDPFDGLEDLKKQKIQAIGDKTFLEDASRLLRAVRLAAELTFKIDRATEALIRRDAHLIASVAGERIREELIRLLSSPEAGNFVLYLDELGILTNLIPELVKTKGVEQPKEHFWNVFEHSVKVIAAVSFLMREGAWEYDQGKILDAVPWSERLVQYFDREVRGVSSRKTLLKLAALLHDIAKPEAKTIEPDGRIRFLGHAKVGAEKVADILKRLRFSGKEIELVELMVSHHLRPGQLSQEGMPSNRAIYRYFRDCADAGIDTLFLSLADHLATRGPNLILTHWQRHAQMVEYVLTQHFQGDNITSPPKLVSGDDLIGIFGLSPGPRLGKILESIREAQAAGEISNREEALAYIHDHLLSKIS